MENIFFGFFKWKTLSSQLDFVWIEIIFFFEFSMFFFFSSELKKILCTFFFFFICDGGERLKIRLACQFLINRVFFIISHLKSDKKKNFRLWSKMRHTYFILWRKINWIEEFCHSQKNKKNTLNIFAFTSSNIMQNHSISFIRKKLVFLKLSNKYFQGKCYHLREEKNAYVEPVFIE